MKFYIFIFLFLSALNSNAWNSVGHRLAAQIAYDNMSHKSQKLIRSYNRLLNTKGRKYSLIYASVWMDTLYAEKYKNLRGLHYVDLPFVENNLSAPSLKSYNAIFAVENSIKILKNPQASKIDKALAFRILWHVVADLHQPMHAVSHFSKQYPNGDRGGNLVVLPKNKVAKNLHAYWDRGAGIFYKRKPMTNKQIKLLENYMLSKWPCDKNNVNINPSIWAKESYSIAVNFAYSFQIYGDYANKTQEIAMQRVALAGCRLAAIIDDFADMNNDNSKI